MREVLDKKSIMDATSGSSSTRFGGLLRQNDGTIYENLVGKKNGSCGSVVGEKMGRHHVQ
jgi:hypothetical protein